MLLEPGAQIDVHSDCLTSDVAFTCSIALNQPEECKFWIDVNSDGSHNEYTKCIPFKEGTVMLINIAKYHYVVNNSSTPRIHIIAIAPIRKTKLELIQLAQEQMKNFAYIV